MQVWVGVSVFTSLVAIEGLGEGLGSDLFASGGWVRAWVVDGFGQGMGRCLGVYGFG